jgi:hypothetical protein
MAHPNWLQRPWINSDGGSSRSAANLYGYRYFIGNCPFICYYNPFANPYADPRF